MPFTLKSMYQRKISGLVWQKALWQTFQVGHGNQVAINERLLRLAWKSVHQLVQQPTYL